MSANRTCARQVRPWQRVGVRTGARLLAVWNRSVLLECAYGCAFACFFVIAVASFVQKPKKKSQDLGFSVFLRFSKRRPVMLTLLRGSSLKIPSLKDPTARQFLAQIKSDAQNTITVRAFGSVFASFRFSRCSRGCCANSRRAVQTRDDLYEEIFSMCAEPSCQHAPVCSTGVRLEPGHVQDLGKAGSRGCSPGGEHASKEVDCL